MDGIPVMGQKGELGSKLGVRKSGLLQEHFENNSCNSKSFIKALEKTREV